MKNTVKKIIVCLLIFAFSVSMLVACESAPLEPNKLALTEVGKIGDFSVNYDEFYAIVNTYRAELDAKYGKDAYNSNEKITVADDEGEERTVILSEYYLEELKRSVSDNIVYNYAVLTLCEEVGLTLDSEETKEGVQTSLDAYIESDFGGKRGEYKKALKEQGLTDNYVRFNLGVDYLYSQITAKYLATGVIEDDEDRIKEIIENEFVRTWHIMILNEDGDIANYERAKEALSKIESGTSMYEMIGSKYNEDLMLTTLHGYYFTKGNMDKSYEDAAYSLEINETSGIVESVGEDAYGNTVDCYYIIQRLELEDDYIETNFEELMDKYTSSIVLGMVEELSDSLKFETNDYCDSLDLISLEAPKESDPVVTTAVVSSVVGTILVAATVLVIVLAVKKKKEKILKLAESNKARQLKGK